MSARRQANNQNGSPEALDSVCRNNGKNAHCAKQHGGLAGEVDTLSSSNHPGGKPAAGDAADIRDDIDHNDRYANLHQCQSMVALQKVRNPEQVKPPDGINEEFSGNERPRRTI